MNRLIGLITLVLLLPQCTAAEKANPARWEEDIRAFEAADAKQPPPQNGVVFIGSSSIRLWTTLATDFPGVQRNADDASRRHQDLLRRAANRVCGCRRHAAGDVESGLSRTRIGAAAIDDDRARAAARLLEVFTRDDDRRRDSFVGGEDRGGADRPIGGDQCQIERGRAVGGALDSARDPGRPKSRRRRDPSLDDLQHARRLQSQAMRRTGVSRGR